MKVGYGLLWAAVFAPSALGLVWVADLLLTPKYEIPITVASTMVIITVGGVLGVLFYALFSAGCYLGPNADPDAHDSSGEED